MNKEKTNAAAAQAIEHFESFQNEIRPLFGQVVLIHDTEIAKLHGIGTNVHDYYYIARTLRPRNPENPITWYSAAGHIQPLKGILPDDTYNRMETVFKLNDRGNHTPTEFQVLVDDNNGPAPYTRDAFRSFFTQEVEK
jgi:hypothetical protein